MDTRIRWIMWLLNERHFNSRSKRFTSYRMTPQRTWLNKIKWQFKLVRLLKKQKSKVRNSQLLGLHFVHQTLTEKHTRKTLLDKSQWTRQRNKQSHLNSWKFRANSHLHGKGSASHKQYIKSNCKGHFASCCHSRKSVQQIKKKYTDLSDSDSNWINQNSSWARS